MYLQKPDVLNIFSRISSAVSGSGFVFEVVNERYTRGFWKKMLISKMKRNLGSAAGASFDFGVRDSTEIESYGEGIRVIEEWSYFEDENIKPAILKLFRNWKFMSRTQWTVNPHFSPVYVARRWRRRAGKACNGGPRSRT